MDLIFSKPKKGDPKLLDWPHTNSETVELIATWFWIKHGILLKPTDGRYGGIIKFDIYYNDLYHNYKISVVGGAYTSVIERIREVLRNEGYDLDETRTTWMTTYKDGEWGKIDGLEFWFDAIDSKKIIKKKQ